MSAGSELGDRPVAAMVERPDFVPAPAPLAMPVQRLEEGRLQGRRLPTTPSDLAWRRFAVIGGAVGMTLVAAHQMWWLLSPNGISLSEAMLLLVFVPLFAWTAMSFFSALGGFVSMLARSPAPLGLSEDAPLPQLGTRTALLMPVYNEDPHRVFAGLQAMIESLGQTGQAGHFDVFVLSDTRRPEIHQAELAAFAHLRSVTRAGQVALYYRRRENNHERKAGNISDWVRRWGGAYPQFLILDADSLMAGDTLVRVAGAMERDENVALIQTLPLIANSTTLFARMQQFSARVYGPVAAHGVAWWHGSEGNYWGHNAMIRTRAFADCAGLPELKGLKPFSGTVLSHDFVEAALLRRGGWAVHLAPGLKGSFEEVPPTLTDMLVRDRRWCQGNLQHVGVLPTRGLHWLSRLHLTLGIFQYLTAPLWGLLLFFGLMVPLQELTASNNDYALFGYWVRRDSSSFVLLFTLTMMMLLAPKLLGYSISMLDRNLRAGCGGALRSFVAMLLEMVLAAVMAPVVMYVQSRGVVEVLAGKDSGWESQRRDDGSRPLRGLIDQYRVPMILGPVLAVVAWWLSPGLALWMSPVILGLTLSVPIVMLTSSTRAGAWLRGKGLLCTPEESDPGPLLLRAQQLRDAGSSDGGDLDLGVAPPAEAATPP